MKVLLQGEFDPITSSKIHDSIAEGFRILHDFWVGNHLPEEPLENLVTTIEVFQHRNDFLDTLAQDLDVDSSGMEDTFVGVATNQHLYLMNPSYYAKVYPEGIERQSYAKLVAHELAHLAHEKYVDHVDQDMGPIWFYEGFAVAASTQWIGQDDVLTPSQIESILTHEGRLFYRYFGSLFRVLMTKFTLTELLDMAKNNDFVIQIRDRIQKTYAPWPNGNWIEPRFHGTNKRPMVLVIPGGGYAYASSREGWPVANRFFEEGFHVGVYWYREKIVLEPYLLEEAFRDLGWLEKDPRISGIIVMGFSAGGHFALSMMEAKPTKFLAGILAYPVVSARKPYAHERSIETLLGHLPNPAERKRLSLEEHVSTLLPPLFVWHTMEDSTVPYENSVMLAQSIQKQGAVCELHLYPKGSHGLALADETTPFEGCDPQQYRDQHRHVATWFSLAVSFLWLNLPIEHINFKRGT
ncbi:MAG: alpha/beta hydrolase [Candidatus Izemoplasmatales bacterium]|nr:alpha/beta hydrolase [Candidatus Izemoplasmatales bacterium]